MRDGFSKDDFYQWVYRLLLSLLILLGHFCFDNKLCKRS